MFPFAVDDELELVRTGRDGRHYTPHAAALVEHLDRLPVVPVPGQLYVVLRAVRVDELGLDPVDFGLAAGTEHGEVDMVMLLFLLGLLLSQFVCVLLLLLLLLGEHECTCVCVSLVQFGSVRWDNTLRAKENK